MLHRRWFPDQIVGETVVLRRHTRENLRDFLRWYQDPEVARLTRYQDGPMRADEIERFFLLRAMGPDSMAMGIHVRETDRLIGSCAFSQLDGDNGSVLFHITIGEHDCWGHGYGSEATALMVDHAFESLGLHRVALTVFAFNERAIRSYQKVGFVIEGTAREAIWRDGRWWDEIHMSVLEPEWRAARWQARAIADGRLPTPASPQGAPTTSPTAPGALDPERPAAAASLSATGEPPLPSRGA
jgi:RimJ/RimL family protein N-acetyltransferase